MKKASPIGGNFFGLFRNSFWPHVHILKQTIVFANTGYGTQRENVSCAAYDRFTELFLL